MKSINPATGEVVCSHQEDTSVEIEAKLNQAHSAFRDWRKTPVADRMAALVRVADALDAEVDELAQTITTEMGKPLSQARGEVKKCAWVLRYYAEHAPSLLEPSVRDLDGTRAVVRYDPLGVVFAVMPWNYPFWQVFRFAAPALAAGNVMMVKHAPNTWGCMKAIEKVAGQAGLPTGLLSGLYVDVPEVQAVIEDPRVSAVTLTGSERAGAAVGAHAGHALKKCVLELGGSDAAIVLADADVDKAVKGVLGARMGNSGQACCNAKRIIVVRAIADRFVPKFVEAVQALQVGSPTVEGVEIGPLARADLRATLLNQIEESVAQGGRILTGCTAPDGPGYFVTPGVVSDLPPDSPAARQELFGPVAALFVVEDLDEAIALANDSEYGLCASIWTSSPEEAATFAGELEVGGVFINRIPTSDPRVPFGGVKKSGFGRELGEVGFREFVNAKTVCIGD